MPSLRTSRAFPLTLQPILLFALALFKVTLQVLALYLYLSLFSTSTSHLTTTLPFQFSFTKTDTEEEKAKKLLHLRPSSSWEWDRLVRSLSIVSVYLTPSDNLTYSYFDWRMCHTIMTHRRQIHVFCLKNPQWKYIPLCPFVRICSKIASDPTTSIPLFFEHQVNLKAWFCLEKFYPLKVYYKSLGFLFSNNSKSDLLSLNIKPKQNISSWC